MAGKNDMEMLSTMLGGQETLQMLQRMERLKKLIGTPQTAEQPANVPAEAEGDIFARSKQEDMITAAIPFLNREYQKGIYVIARLMEMRRVLEGAFLETRERQADPPEIRKQKMLRAMQPYLAQSEREKMERIMKMMTVKAFAGWEEKK